MKPLRLPVSALNSLAMALVQAAMDEDYQQTLVRLCDAIQPVDVFADLATFYARVGARVTPEQKEISAL